MSTDWEWKGKRTRRTTRYNTLEEAVQSWELGRTAVRMINELTFDGLQILNLNQVRMMLKNDKRMSASSESRRIIGILF